MRTLLTNDDGAQAPGLLALKTALSSVAETTVIAPDRPRSASGHAITLHKPLRVAQVHLADGSPARATSGTPSDCVMLALRGLLGHQPDIVFSGINDGPNLGWDLTYSGTVSAAMEACMFGVPAVAISVVRMDALPYVREDDDLLRTDRPPLRYEVAAAFAVHLAGVLAEHRLPPYTLLNVNVPSLPIDKITGVRLTRQGVRQYVGDVVVREDPAGRPYYWLGGDKPRDVIEDGTDVHAIHHHAISVTPVHMDLTAYPVLDALHQWTRIEEFTG